MQNEIDFISNHDIAVHDITNPMDFRNVYALVQAFESKGIVIKVANHARYEWV